MKKTENITKIWAEYEKGLQYNRLKGMYNETEENYNFYHGNQWSNAKLGDIKPITLNIIKPIVKYKIGVLNSNGYSIVFNQSNFDNSQIQERTEKLCEHLSKNTNKIWELEQIDSKVAECVKDSCINSEGILYSFYNSNKNGIESQVIDKDNVSYGNEADSDIQSQPYIIISFRKTVDSVKEEARENGISEEEIENIVSDSEIAEKNKMENLEQEISPMCLMLLKLYKKDGIIHSIKSTRNVIVQEETPHNLKLYPVAHMIWEDVKNSSRGAGEVHQNINNQIELNKTATRRAISIKTAAYQRAIVNTDHIKNISDLNKIGATIKISGTTVDDIKKHIGYLNPTVLSPDSKIFQDELMQNTRELAGAGDMVTGNVDPTQASGKAILAVQQSAQQPLNEQLNKYKKFLEDIARIWFDIWQAYETDGMTIYNTSQVDEIDELGNKIKNETVVPYKISYEELQNLKVNIKIDITPKSPYDKFAVEQSLENLMVQQKITFEEYVKALPYDSVMPKNILEQILKDREEAKKEIEAMEQQANDELNNIKSQIKLQGQNEEDINSIENIGKDEINNIIGGIENGM